MICNKENSVNMIFSSKNKSRKTTQRYRAHPPSWKTYRTQKRGFGGRRSLVSIRTPKLVISELRLLALKITYNLLFVLLLVGIVYLLFFSEWFQINDILLEGNKITDKRLVLDSVEPFMHKKSFYIFPSNNFFFVPTGQIKKEILANFKRIGGVDVSRGFPTSLAIRIYEKKAVLLFCSNEGCVWVDEEGIAYNKSSYAEAVAESNNVVIVQDNSHSDLKMGTLATDPAYVDFANALWNSFPESTGKELLYLSTPLPSAEEIRANTKEGWMVYFDTTISIERSISLLQKVIDQEINVKEGGTACLDYIDLRVTDKVFYKMKDNCGNNQNGEGEQGEQNNSNNNENVNAEENLETQDNANQNTNKTADNDNTNKDKKSSKKKKN